MQRTSERLRNNGYYDMYGNPVISYRETSVRARKRRPANREVTFRGRIDSRENYLTDQEIQMIDTLMNLMQFGFNIFVFVFLMFVAFGLSACFKRIISLQSQPSELSATPTLIDMVAISGCKDEGHPSRLQLLERKLDYLLPQADLWANFALESQGAMILHKASSTTYRSHRACGLFGTSFRLPPISPNIVIKGRTTLDPGQCWAFADFPGRLSIALSHKATVTHVSLGHIPKIVSPTSSISSAPREFSVYGKKNLEDGETHLGTFLYDEDGDQIQTFKLPVNVSN